MFPRMYLLVYMAALPLSSCSDEAGQAGSGDAAVSVGDAGGPDGAFFADAATHDAAGGCTGTHVSCDGTCIDAIAPTATALTARVFMGSCGFASSCHGGISPKEGLALDTVDHLLASAVAQASKQAAGRRLVEPGNAGASYLVDKLRGTNLAQRSSTGTSPTTVMPQPPSDPLCAAKIDAVVAWINAGALR